MTNTQKKRVLLCITELDVGGAENALVDLATRVDLTEFSLQVVALKSRGEHDILAKKLEACTIDVTFLGINSWWQLPRGLRDLCKICRDFQPHIFHSFLFHANLLGRFAAWITRVPHFFAGVRVAEREKTWHIWLDFLTRGLVEKYVCVSEDVAAFVRRKIFGNREKKFRERIVVIPNGINVAIYKDAIPASLAQENIAALHKKIIVIGRLHPQKGIDWLLEIAPTWLGELPLWELLIVGEGSQKSQLQQKITAPRFAEVQARIHFFGWRDDIPALLAASTLLVMPSRWEGMPNVLLQAMAAGKPVLASRVEGVAELLGSRAAEQTFQLGDEEEFLTALALLTQNSDLAESLGEENQNRAEKLFSIESVIEKYVALWNNCWR